MPIRPTRFDRAFRDEGIELPVKSRDGEVRGIVWRLPAYNIVHNILTNPIYAGAYAFGRTTSKVSVEQGRKRVRRGVHRLLERARMRAASRPPRAHADRPEIQPIRMPPSPAPIG